MVVVKSKQALVEFRKRLLEGDGLRHGYDGLTDRVRGPMSKVAAAHSYQNEAQLIPCFNRWLSTTYHIRRCPRDRDCVLTIMEVDIAAQAHRGVVERAEIDL